MALFGEKYGDRVRVLSFGDFSTELCGGTHVRRSGDIGVFKIISESGIASGVRRLEATTGVGALQYIAGGEQALAEIGRLVRSNRDEAAPKVAALFERAKRLEKEVEQLKGKLASSQSGDLATSAVTGGDMKVLSSRMDGLDAKALRAAVDKLKTLLGRCVVVLGSVGADGKVTLVAGVTEDLVQTIRAGDIVAATAVKVGGKGGGRADFAQAGGNDASQLDAALAGVVEFVRVCLFV